MPFNWYISIKLFRSNVHIKKWNQIKDNLEMFYGRDIQQIINWKDEKNIAAIYIKERSLTRSTTWADRLLIDGRKFVIGEGYLGEGFFGVNILDLSVYPHGIVAGSTSSGKSALMRLIAHQAILKGYNLSILDFKSGGDFASTERDYCSHNNLETGQSTLVISEPDGARALLKELVAETAKRMSLIKNANATNIDEYNKLGSDYLNTWILIIDETAEILDVKPKDKDEKELYIDIEQSLKTLARTSRAAGIHIFLGIIRPDSNVIDGQIKNNMLWRACGYFADPAASRIVIDNDKATKLPPDIKGRFIIGDNEVQVYYLPTTR